MSYPSQPAWFDHCNNIWWLRRCATSRTVPGSIPGVSLDFSVTYSFRPYHGLGVDSASSENEYHEHFLGVKAAGAWGWRPHHLHMPNVMKSGSLNLLEPSGPHRVCYGTPLPFNSIWWEWATDNEAPHYTVFSSLLLRIPSKHFHALLSTTCILKTWVDYKEKWMKNIRFRWVIICQAARFRKECGCHCSLRYKEVRNRGRYVHHSSAILAISCTIFVYRTDNGRRWMFVRWKLRYDVPLNLVLARVYNY